MRRPETGRPDKSSLKTRANLLRERRNPTANMTKNAKQISFMLRKGLHLLAICASRLSEGVEACIPRMRRVTAIAWFAAAAWGLIVEGNLSAATVPPGFTESVISGPWPDAVGITFENNGRMYVWERTGRLWFKDPGDPSPSLLLDISEEVGAWEDHGMLGFALDPEFRVNGYIYVLYVVDRYYLLHFGDPNYDPNANEYNAATIGRLTRYTCRSSDGFRSVDPASRQILIGETKQTGFPICSYTHGVGSLVFGEDGTLLVSAGDGATADTPLIKVATSAGSYAPQALADGIIRPKEDIGAFRSQLVDSLEREGRCGLIQPRAMVCPAILTTTPPIRGRHAHGFGHWACEIHIGCR